MTTTVLTIVYGEVKVSSFFCSFYTRALTSFDDDFNQTLAEAKHDQVERKKLKPKLTTKPSKVRLKPSTELTNEQKPLPTSALCVNPKKINELQTWLGSKVKKLLMLSGPPGSAKETALRSVCAELNLPITEWKNPPSTGGGDAGGFVNMGNYETLGDEECAQFALFIHKATLFTHGIVLIKELPHKFEQHPAEFEQIITQEKVWHVFHLMLK